MKLNEAPVRMSEMELCTDPVGAMLSHKLSKLPLVEQELIRTEFKFQGVSLGLEKDFELLRAIRLSLRNEHLKAQEILRQNGELPPLRQKRKP